MSNGHNIALLRFLRHWDWKIRVGGKDSIPLYMTPVKYILTKVYPSVDEKTWTR